MTDSTNEKKLAEPAAKPGTARIFRIRDFSVFVHWSLPLVVLSLALLASLGHEGALVVCFVACGLWFVFDGLTAARPTPWRKR